MPARQVFYKEALTTVGVSTNAFVEVGSLTWTNAASKAYFLGGSWGVRHQNPVENIVSQLMYMEVGVTATVGDFGFQAAGTAASVLFEKREHFAFRKVTTPASAGTQTLSLRGLNTTTATYGEFTNIRLFAIRVTAADAYGERNPGISVAANTWSTHASATFTPGSTGTYVVIGHTETRTGAAGTKPAAVRITHQGTARGLEGYPHNENMNAYKNFPIIDIFSCNGAGANTITIDTCCSALGGLNVSAATGFGCVAALRADSFISAFSATTDTTATTSAATFATALALTTTLSNNAQFGVFALARYRRQDVTAAFSADNISVTDFMVSGVTAAEGVQMTYGTVGAMGYIPFGLFTRVTGNGATNDLHFMQRRAGSAANGVDIAYQRIIVLQLTEAPAGGGGGGFKPFWFYHHQNKLYQ